MVELSNQPAPIPRGTPRDPDKFDPDYYLRANDDVRARGFDPTDHYFRFGRAEGRPANAFQAARRLRRDSARLGDGDAAHPAAALAAPAPAARGEEGPAAVEDPTLANRPAVPAPDGEPDPPAGLAEGPDPIADATPPGWFDAGWYRSQNRDVRTFEVDPYLHYLEYGFREERPPNRAMAKLGRSVSPRNRSPRQVAQTITTIGDSGLFDANWYCEQYGVPPERAIAHYVSTGAFLGNDPSPFFSSLDYIRANLDTLKEGVNPFLHYIEFGFLENRPGVKTLSETRLTARVWLKGL